MNIYKKEFIRSGIRSLIGLRAISALVMIPILLLGVWFLATFDARLLYLITILVILILGWYLYTVFGFEKKDLEKRKGLYKNIFPKNRAQTLTSIDKYVYRVGNIVVISIVAILLYILLQLFISLGYL